LIGRHADDVRLVSPSTERFASPDLAAPLCARPFSDDGFIV